MRRRKRFDGPSSWGYFPTRSTPRKARGGIKAQSKRGGFGATWWGKRWIEALESFDIGARLARGRSYARQGQVLSIAIEPGRIRSKVQGSRARPYELEIRLETIPKPGWQRLAKRLLRKPALAAGLFAGDLPAELEEAFQAAKLALFPVRYVDFETACSCPDDASPCKHLAAVFYLLAEEFDRDPFLIFRLRGIEKEELVALLGKEQGKDEAPAPENAPPPPEPEPLPADPSAFWGEEDASAAPPVSEPIAGTPNPAHASLLRRLGAFPFWRGEERFIDALERVYEEARPRGLEIAAGVKSERPSV